MPKANSENWPFNQYIIAKPNRVPKTTGNNSRGMVFHCLKQTNRNNSTRTKAPVMVVVRSCLI